MKGSLNHVPELKRLGVAIIMLNTATHRGCGSMSALVSIAA